MHRRLPVLLLVLVLVMLTACGAAESAPPTTQDLATPVSVIVVPVIATPTPAPISTTIVESYVVRSGDTLGGISARYDVPIEDLMKLNGLTNPNSLKIGQVLKVTQEVTRGAPADFILADSELVYGSAYASFDVTNFASQQGGYLASYSEKVDGELLTGPQIIQLVAERYSVGPRALLTLLEYQGGWVTSTALSQSQVANPLGLQEGSRASLFYQASVVANRLNEGYYGKLSGRLAALRFKDRTRARVAPNANPGTVAVQNLFSYVSNWDVWQNQVGPTGFIATYRRLFGDPPITVQEPVVPPGLKQPPLALPWNNGTTWFYTGGPHSAWGDLAAWSALDLTPGDVSGSGSCYASRDWALATAPGRVVRAEHGRVVLSLSNSDFQGSGWALLYMHIATTGRAVPGTQLNAGDRIGHPSCEGGDANASHLHLARLYNGQWMDPETVPFVLSGWQITSSSQQYDGGMVRGTETREALNGRDNTKNAVVSDGK